MPHSQVHQGMDGRTPHQDNVMASTFSRLEPNRKPLQCFLREGDGTAIKQSKLLVFIYFLHQEWHKVTQ